jgi:glutamyl/glutaminyl-tRNA synthetase
MDKSTMIKLFDLKHISKAPAAFDYNKMLWIAKEHMQRLDDVTYIKFVKKFIDFDTSYFGDKLTDVLLLFKKQISYAQQLNELITTTFFNTNLVKNINSTLLNAFKNEIQKCDQLNYDNATTIIKNIQQQTNLKGKELFMPLRLFLTGNEHGPELNKIIAIIGKEKITKLL